MRTFDGPARKRRKAKARKREIRRLDSLAGPCRSVKAIWLAEHGILPAPPPPGPCPF